MLTGCSQNLTLTNQTFVLELGVDVYANPSLYLENPEKVDLDRLSVEADAPGINHYGQPLCNRRPGLSDGRRV